jgi:hypothetical protein
MDDFRALLYLFGEGSEVSDACLSFEEEDEQKY